MSAERHIDSALISTHLSAAVPLHAAIAACWSLERASLEAERCADILAAGADVLFRADETFSPADLHLPTVDGIAADQIARGVKARSYRPAEIFNALAKAIGIGCHVPGGVTLPWGHWCAAPHEGCPSRREAA